MQFEDLLTGVPQKGPDMLFPERCIQQLRATGLYVSASDGEYKRLSIVKPKAVAGNSIPGYESTFTISFEPLDQFAIDAPIAMVWSRGKRWAVLVHDFIPYAGPGDFEHEFDRPEDAVADLLEYYFGDSPHFQERVRHEAKMARRSDDSQQAPLD